MGFNSISFIPEASTYFGLQKGFNSIAFIPESVTYFGLQKGFNSTGFAAEISIGRLLLDSNLFTDLTNITISSTLGVYQLSTSSGYFPVYPFYSDPETITQIIIEADSGQYIGEVTITPTTPQIIDVDLELVSGMAAKITASVVIPELASNAIEADVDDLPFNTIKCCESEIVLTDEIGTNNIKNDKSSFLFRKYAPADTIAFELWKGGVKVADITDSSLGDYYDFGDLEAQPEYKGLVLDWFSVWGAYGYGVYQLKVNQNILGNSSVLCSRSFYLRPYSAINANGTVKIEAYQFGNILSSAFDYTGLLENGWYSSYRIKGVFGFKSPINESDKYVTSDYKQEQIQQTIKNEYTLQTKLITPAVADVLVYDSFTANQIFITDYNINNNGIYTRTEVCPVSFEPTYYSNNEKPSYSIKLEDAIQNRIKRNF